MKGLLNNMPESSTSFEIAKTSLLNQIRSERITKTDILFTYDSDKKLGIDYDVRKDVYNEVPSMTMVDLKNFQQKYLKDKRFITNGMNNSRMTRMETDDRYL